MSHSDLVAIGGFLGYISVVVTAIFVVVCIRK